MSADIKIDTPEHDKTEKVQAVSQAIGEFLDWLGEEGSYADAVGETSISLCVREIVMKRAVEKELDDGEKSYDDLKPDDYRVTSRYVPAPVRFEALLARYFEIDLDALEREKRMLLDVVRAMNKRGGS